MVIFEDDVAVHIGSPRKPAPLIANERGELALVHMLLSSIDSVLPYRQRRRAAFSRFITAQRRSHR